MPKSSELLSDFSLTTGRSAEGIGTGKSTECGTGRIADARIHDALFVFLVVPFCFSEAEITICDVVFLFSPNHWHSKFKRHVFSSKPFAKFVVAIQTTIMGSPDLILVTNSPSKVGIVQALDISGQSSSVLLQT